MPHSLQLAVVAAGLLAMAAAAAAAAAAAGGGDSAELPGWVRRADELQRLVGRTLPLPLHGLQGTHNSFNYDNRASLSLQSPKNQLHSLDAQMRRMGARVVEVDLHHVTLPSTSRWDRVRVCHTSPSWAAALSEACAQGGGGGWSSECDDEGLLDLGNQTGCPASARTANETLAEVRRFLDDEPAEFVLLYLEHYLGPHRDLLLGLVEGYFGDLLFRLDEPLAAGAPANAAEWPSVAELVASGRRVAVFSNPAGTSDRGPTTALWDQSLRQRGSVTDFDPDECTTLSRGEPVGPGVFFTYLKGDSAVTRLPNGSVLDDGTEGGANVLTDELVRQGRACGFAPAYDLQAAHSVEAGVWLWDAGHPLAPDGTAPLCAAFFLADGASRGRLRSVPCDGRYSAACRRAPNATLRAGLATEWVVAGEAAGHPRGRAAPPSCPDGFELGVPRHPLEAKALLDAPRADGVPIGAAVWTSLVANATGCWSAGADLEVACMRGDSSGEGGGGGGGDDGDSSSRSLVIGGAVASATLLVLCACCCVASKVRRNKRGGHAFYSMRARGAHADDPHAPPHSGGGQIMLGAV